MRPLSLLLPFVLLGALSEDSSATRTPPPGMAVLGKWKGQTKGKAQRARWWNRSAKMDHESEIELWGDPARLHPGAEVVLHEDHEEPLRFSTKSTGRILTSEPGENLSLRLQLRFEGEGYTAEMEDARNRQLAALGVDRWVKTRLSDANLDVSLTIYPLHRLLVFGAEGAQTGQLTGPIGRIANPFFKRVIVGSRSGLLQRVYEPAEASRGR